MPDVPPDAPAADRDALARAIDYEPFRPIVLGMASRQRDRDRAYHIADRILASGVLVDPADVRARALEDAADELEGRLGIKGTPTDLWEFRKWLRDRAVSEREGAT